MSHCPPSEKFRLESLVSVPADEAAIVFASNVHDARTRLAEMGGRVCVTVEEWNGREYQRARLR